MKQKNRLSMTNTPEKKQYTNCESDKISELRELGVAIIDMLKEF